MEGPGGTLVWVSKEHYAAGTELLDGELGKIGSFRYVGVKDMEREYGAGVAVGGAADAATVGQQAAAYKTNGKYDVFTAMVIGDDSFSITGFGSNNTSAQYIKPVADVHNDMHGQIAGIAANWSYGFLCYRPERICSLRFALSKNPSLF
jgi:N4-gp56 family major capsid protein